MPHRIPMFIDFAVAFTAMASALAAKIMLLAQSADDAHRVDVLAATLVPLIGALAAALACYLFSTRANPEARAVIGGRAIVAGFGGVIVPRVVFMLNPHAGLSAIMLDPILLMGMGFVAGWFTYILAYPFFASAQQRAPKIADEQMERINAALNEGGKPK